MVYTIHIPCKIFIGVPDDLESSTVVYEWVKKYILVYTGIYRYILFLKNRKKYIPVYTGTRRGKSITEIPALRN